MDYVICSNELYHHGIKGQKWGVRRYQNYDGTYTKKGLERYNNANKDFWNAQYALTTAKKQRRLVKKTMPKSTAEEKAARKKEIARLKGEAKQARLDKRAARKNMRRAENDLQDYYKYDEGKRRTEAGETITKNKFKSIGARFVADFLTTAAEVHYGEDSKAARYTKLGSEIAAGYYQADIKTRNAQIRKYKEVNEFKRKWG